MSKGMEMLVFQDAAGDYYVMPRQAWEQARVPRNRRGEVEQLLGKGQKVQAVHAKKRVKLEDLPAKGLAAERAKTIKGGAVALQPVGSFTTKVTMGKALAGSDWAS
jgi:hypothetical protein